MSNIGRPNGPAYPTGELLNTPTPPGLVLARFVGRYRKHAGVQV